LVYRQSGKLDSARSTLEKAAQFQPNSVSVLISLAEVADQQHDYHGALEYLAHARELDSKNAGIHFFWGIVCIEQNLGMEAYQSLKKAVSLDPGNAYYNYALGAVAMQFVNAGESVAYFQKYCELRPDDPRGRLALGTAFFGSHEDEKAQKLMTSVIQYPETAATAHYYLGRIASQQGDLDAAIRELESALQASPHYADAYAELGLIYMKRNEYQKAEESLERAFKANPESYTANLDLLILYQRTKDPRVEEQAKRFEKVKQDRAQKTADNLRAVEVQPVYSTN
jgi:tetratricopeptide (TPR) repeat protein